MQALDKLVSKIVEIIEKIEQEFKKKNYTQLGVLATYLC